MADVSIVIPVFNELHYTRGCLESLKRAGVPDTVLILVDNASTDGTREFLAAKPELRVITNEKNRGCSVAWNLGVEAAAAEWFFILNNDTILAQGCVEGLVNFAEESGCDIVTPARAEGEFDYDFEEFALTQQKTLGTASRLGTASGSAFMVHRRVFDRIGLFDTKIGLAGNEDDDFFRRARQAGFRLAITGRAFLHHYGSITRKSVNIGMGRDSRAPLTDKDYYRKKHGLTWARRRLERLQEKTMLWYWRWNERKRFGLTLKMVRLDGKWHYH